MSFTFLFIKSCLQENGAIEVRKTLKIFFENFDSGFIISFESDSSEFYGKRSFFLKKKHFSILKQADDNWTW